MQEREHRPRSCDDSTRRGDSQAGWNFRKAQDQRSRLGVSDGLTTCPWSRSKAILSAGFRSRVRAMGIRDRPISPGSPWQNPYLERLIGTVRRECLDGMLVFGEAHLRQILSSYAAYYNEVRTHLALRKDAPLGRTVQRTGLIVAIPILSGLHHHYVRI